MAENERTPDCENGAALKEAVCIDAMRIYDSCSDKDCLEDLRVLFPASVQPVVDASANVRVRDVDVISVYIDMQPIPFNRGYYSIDLTFFFDVIFGAVRRRDSGLRTRERYFNFQSESHSLRQ